MHTTSQLHGQPVVVEAGRDDPAGVARPTGDDVAAWIWGRPGAVVIVVTTIGADGRSQRWYGDLRPGRDQAETIELPDGAQAVTIERPQRVRIDLGQHRARRAR